MSAPRTLDASDHVAIAELLTRWTRCLDSADLEGFVDLFEPGGVVHDSSDRHAGPVSLAAREYALRRYGEEGFPGRQHWTAHTELQPIPEGCWARSFGMATHLHRSGATAIPWLGSYEDVLVRHGRDWRFRERTISPWNGARLAGFPELVDSGVGGPGATR